MTFAVVVTDGLRALGLRVTEDQANDWFYVWRQVGKALGIVEPKGFPLESAADGADFFDHVREDWGPSPEGSTLARTSLDVMRELLPAPELDGVGPTLVRHLAGERCADILGVAPSDWTQLLVDPSPLISLVESRIVGPSLFETPLTPLLQQAAFGTMEALSGQQREREERAVLDSARLPRMPGATGFRPSSGPEPPRCDARGPARGRGATRSPFDRRARRRA